MKNLSKETILATRILIIDDEGPIREVLSESIKDEGYQVATAFDGESGLKAIKDFNPHLVFLDIWMPGSMDGMEVLSQARIKFPDVDFIMISGHGTIETAVRATKTGAWDFIEKPLSMDKIFITIANAIWYRQEKEEKLLLLNKLRESIALIGECPGMISAKQTISRVAGTDSNVLIHGESGTGKQLIAKNIHYMSSRAGHVFATLNCQQIPEDLQEGELFGFEKGALPGMERAQKGRIELAQNGTLYISEIHEMTPACQSSLLKYLQDRKFQRVGGSEFIRSEVRIITSSTRDLEDLVRKGIFRGDLYYRLNSSSLILPPLRERIADVQSLANFFSDLVAREGGFAVKVLSERAREALQNYRWPGNVRELKNFIERVYILTPSEFVDLHDIRFAGLVDSTSGNGGFEEEQLSTFREARAKFEKEYLLKKIGENGGNISRTAEVIGLERSYLHRKIKSYGIEVN
jgi:two-component system nitrogen regulation response regulator NtrX